MPKNPAPYSAMTLIFDPSGQAILDVPATKSTGLVMSLTGMIPRGAKKVTGFRPSHWFRVDVYRGVRGIDATMLRTLGTSELLKSCFDSDVAYTQTATPTVLDLKVNEVARDDQYRGATEITVPQNEEPAYWERFQKGIKTALDNVNKPGPNMLLALREPGKLILLQSWPTSTQHTWFERAVLGPLLNEFGLTVDDYTRTTVGRSLVSTDGLMD